SLTGVTSETFVLNGGAKVDGSISINNPNATSTVNVTVDGNGNADPSANTVGQFLSVITGNALTNVLVNNGAVIGSNFGWIMGDARDVVHTDNATFHGAIFGTMGNGNDALFLEGPSDTGSTTVDGFVSVLFGNGNDSVNLGETADSLTFTSPT